LVDGHHPEVMAHGLLAEAVHVGLGCIGMQVGVIDEACKFV
jgi:hypothetical protein